MRRLSKWMLEEPTLFMSWLLFVGGSLIAVGVWIYTKHIATDFGVFWRTAREPIALVYTPHARYPFPYPPSAKLFLSPLSLAPKWPAFVLWSLLSAWALWKSFRDMLGLWPSVMVMVSPPVTNGLATGQSTMLLTAAMLWALRTDSRIWAGVAFGIVGAIKPQLLLFLPLLLLLRRDWTAIVATILAAGAILAMATLIYGVSAWNDWLAALPHFRQTLYDLKIANSVITVPGFFDRLGLPMFPVMIAGALAGTALVVWGEREDFIDQAALIAISSFLVAPYALGYDLILAAPYLVRQIFRRNVLATFVLAGAPNPVPVLLGAASLAGAKLKIANLTGLVRERSTPSNPS